MILIVNGGGGRGESDLCLHICTRAYKRKCQNTGFFPTDNFLILGFGSEIITPITPTFRHSLFSPALSPAPHCINHPMSSAPCPQPAPPGPCPPPSVQIWVPTFLLFSFQHSQCPSRVFYGGFPATNAGLSGSDTHSDWLLAGSFQSPDPDVGVCPRASVSTEDQASRPSSAFCLGFILAAHSSFHHPSSVTAHHHHDPLCLSSFAGPGSVEGACVIWRLNLPLPSVFSQQPHCSPPGLQGQFSGSSALPLRSVQCCCLRFCPLVSGLFLPLMVSS